MVTKIQFFLGIIYLAQAIFLTNLHSGNQVVGAITVLITSCTLLAFLYTSINK